MTVIVIGGGLAGLHAAWRLHSAGIDVLVLEAHERVGGRTFSHRLEDGTVVERGGEFIAPADAAIRGLCAELDLELVPHGFSFDRRPTPDGPAPTEAELAAVMASAQARVAARGTDTAAADVLAPPAERSAVEVSAARRLETSLTVPLTWVSARRLFGGGEVHRYDLADRVRAGNQEIARELARRLGADVRLSSPVAALRHDSSGASVRCRDGEELQAAAVVIAVPLPLLLAAVALRPDVEPAGAPLVTHWGGEPWTRGSYVSHGIGSGDADDAAWTRPWACVVLAGEHTAGPAAGSMNGAVASGARAANAVIGLLEQRSRG